MPTPTSSVVVADTATLHRAAVQRNAIINHDRRHPTSCSNERPPSTILATSDADDSRVTNLWSSGKRANIVRVGDENRNPRHKTADLVSKGQNAPRYHKGGHKSFGERKPLSANVSDVS
jgi:hypothetical protein